RLVPDVAPSEMYHSTSVIGVWAEADEALRKLHIGRLRVESMPQSGCAVQINGRQLGVTPFALERAPAGEYRVQVECDHQAGRVHLVQLGDEPAELMVDVDFDRALRSEPRVALVYPGDVQEEMLANHASQLGRWVQAEEVVSLHVDEDRATLRRVRSNDAELLARVEFAGRDAMDAQAPALSSALDRLLAAAAPLAHTARPLPPRADRAGRRLAAVLASLGLGAVAAGAAFEVVRADAERKLAEPDAGADEAHQRDRFQRAQALRWLGVVGGALLSTTAPLFYLSGPAPARAPKWTYAALVAGIGLAAWGSYELARPEHCRLYVPDQGCETWRDTHGRGALALAAAAPLLSFSLTYWIGAHVERARQAQVLLAPSSTSLAVIMRKELW
ncbi:MAG TPA: PEGA domain-containing protein, partial [Polyangiales bacterium]